MHPLLNLENVSCLKKFVVYIAKRKAVAKVPNQLIVNNSVDGAKIADLSVNEDLVVWP